MAEVREQHSARRRPTVVPEGSTTRPADRAWGAGRTASVTRVIVAIDLADHVPVARDVVSHQDARSPSPPPDPARRVGATRRSGRERPEAHPAWWILTGPVDRLVTRLEGLLLLLVLAVGALGVALPGPGRLVDHGGAVDPTLAVLVLSTGISIDAAAVSSARRRSMRLVMVLAATTLILPILAWGVGHLVAGAPRNGVLAVGVAPSEVASVGLVGLVGGEVTVAAALLGTSAVVTVITAGPLLELVAPARGLHPVGLLATLALVVALPLLVGAGLRQRLHLRERALDAARLVGLVALLTLLWEVASEVHLRADYVMVTVALVLFLAGAAVLGWLVSRGLPSHAEPGVLLPVAMRDFAVAAGIASAAFGPSATGPLGIYGLVVLLFGTGAIRLGRRRWSGRHPPG